jgi:hypothetical protein
VSPRLHIRDITPSIGFLENLSGPLLAVGYLLSVLGLMLRAQGGLLRSDCSFVVPLGPNYPPGLAGVNPGRLVIRQVPILYHFGQACQSTLACSQLRWLSLFVFLPLDTCWQM